jgi:hypothetical protein
MDKRYGSPAARLRSLAFGGFVGDRSLSIEDKCNRAGLGRDEMKPDIRYVERKTDGLRGIGRIVRVEHSKTRKTLYFDGKTLAQVSGRALKANYFDRATFEEYWVSKPRQDGNDSLFPAEIVIDENVRETYWLEIRRDPSKVDRTTYKSKGKTKRERERLEKAVRRRDMDRRFRAPRNVE